MSERSPDGARNGYIVAVDSGGTFTDCVVVDPDGRVTTASRRPHHDFSEGVVGSVARAAEGSASRSMRCSPGRASSAMAPSRPMRC